jgi:hypothetical protein
MSHTPRTDAVFSTTDHAGITLDFARTLERELVAMTADRDSWKEAGAEIDAALGHTIKRLETELTAITAERDALKAALENNPTTP